MNKILKILKCFAIILACFFLVMTFTANDCTTGDRIAYVLASCFIFSFIYVASFRNLLLALFFLLLSIAGLASVFDNGSFVWTGALLELTFICASIHFFRKVFRNIHLRRTCHIDMREVDNMTGLDFEHFTADLLSHLGYYRISVTKASGDQGIDVIAHKDGLSYAIQCKHYSGSLGNSAVQEAYAGKTYYGCFYAVVCTNSYFTASAKELAASTGVLLWDRSVLQEMLSQANKIQRSSIPVTTHTPHIVDVRTESPQKAPSTDSTSVTTQSISDDIPTPHNAPVYTANNFSLSAPRPPFRVDEKFIAEAQWYAARGGSDLTEDD